MILMPASLFICLAGCDDKVAQPIAYYAHPSDPAVRAWAMGECLSRSKGPKSTQYNDWDEAIQACNEYAEDLARYCPTRDQSLCQPQYRRTQEQVRSIIAQPKDQSNG
jgi:hypothetical protein